MTSPYPVPAGTVLVRGTCVEILGMGVLLRGPSGSGKSDLALRLIDGGAGLVSDDYVEVRKDAAYLRASAPAAIAGLLEVRGVGVLKVPCAGECALALAVDLIPAAEVPRLPEPRQTEIGGVELPRFALDPFESSAPAKLRALVRTLVAGRRSGART